MKDEATILTTKVFAIIAASTGVLTLTDVDIILGIVLKAISILSCSGLLIVNGEQIFNNIKKWIK